MTQLFSAFVSGSAFATLAIRDSLFDAIILHLVNNLVATCAFSNWDSIENRFLLSLAGCAVYSIVIFFAI